MVNGGLGLDSFYLCSLDVADHFDDIDYIYVHAHRAMWESKDDFFSVYNGFSTLAGINSSYVNYALIINPSDSLLTMLTLRCTKYRPVDTKLLSQRLVVKVNLKWNVELNVT